MEYNPERWEILIKSNPKNIFEVLKSNPKYKLRVGIMSAVQILNKEKTKNYENSCYRYPWHS